MNFSNIRLLRTVKRDTLRLVRSFLDAATVAGAAEVRLTPEQIAQRFVPPLLERRAVLEGGWEPRDKAKVSKASEMEWKLLTTPGLLVVWATRVPKMNPKWFPFRKFVRSAIIGIHLISERFGFLSTYLS